MSGTKTVTVSVAVTAGGGMLDGDDAQMFDFVFDCGNWKIPLSDIVYEKALAEVADRYPGEELIDLDIVSIIKA